MRLLADGYTDRLTDANRFYYLSDMLYAIAMGQILKGRRPLTHHINSITITTKTCTGYKDEQCSANGENTQNINIVDHCSCCEKS